MSEQKYMAEVNAPGVDETSKSASTVPGIEAAGTSGGDKEPTAPIGDSELYMTACSLIQTIGSGSVPATDGAKSAGIGENKLAIQPVDAAQATNTQSAPAVGGNKAVTPAQPAVVASAACEDAMTVLDDMSSKAQAPRTDSDVSAETVARIKMLARYNYPNGLAYWLTDLGSITKTVEKTVAPVCPFCGTVYSEWNLGKRLGLGTHSFGWVKCNSCRKAFDWRIDGPRPWRYTTERPRLFGGCS